MWQPQRSWLQKFVQFNLWATLYGSWALGLFPFIYNSKTRTLRRSRWLVGYGIMLNASLVWMVLTNYMDSDDAVMQLFERNALVEQLNQLHICLMLILLFVTHFRNFWLSKDLARILNVLLQLNYRHFRKHDSTECFKFDNYVTYKSLSIMLEIVSLVAMEFGFSTQYSLERTLTLVSTIMLQLGVLLVGMHFHLAVLYIYRSIWMVNRELLRLVNRHAVKASRVHQLHVLFSRLLELNTDLAAIYDYQMTLFMIAMLCVNIVAVFYFIVYSISLQNTVPFLMVINFIQALSINFIDFWLTIAVCELAERAGHATSTILKLYNDIHKLDVDADRSLNDFALFCSHRRLRFNHCGLFHVHNAMGFRMVITSLLYLVYLVQFDYMNL